MTTVKFSDTSAGGQAPNPGAAAWAASRLGLRVFPLVPGTGLPALKAWPDYATTDDEQIREWWTWAYPGYGVGIACGPSSGVWVLDIDQKKGVDGFASLLELRSANQDYDIRAFTDTMVVTTPSGGAHVYFRWAEGVTNSTGTTNRLGLGLDVRADRGYVRAPGWGGYAVVPRGPENLRLTHVRMAPAWLVALAQKRKHEREGEAMREAHGDTSWARFNAGEALKRLGRTPAGGRNDALNLTAYRLGKLGVTTREDAWTACKAELIGMGAGDDMPAWKRTFHSGWNAGVAKRGKGVG